MTSRKPTPALLSTEPPRGNPDIPPKYLKYPLGSFCNVVHDTAIEWLTDSDKWSLYVTGGLGSGKSCLVGALMNRYRQLQRYGTPPQLRGRFVAPYVFTRIARDFTTSGQIWQMWLKTELLILDDVGASRATEWVTEQLLHLIEVRYDYQRPTVITTNMSVNDFAEHVNPRAASRISEGETLNLGNVDGRRRKQA